MAKIVKGDKVLVIAGKDRNKVGVVEKVFPAKQKVIVTEVNIVKKHLKKSIQNPQGGIIEKAAPIHISNVMLLDPVRNKPTRIGYLVTPKSKDRVAKLSKEVIRKKENE
jgi:large subunit ribosomal protein L24